VGILHLMADTEDFPPILQKGESSYVNMREKIILMMMYQKDMAFTQGMLLGFTLGIVTACAIIKNH
jgi:hypothetical protein